MGWLIYFFQVMICKHSWNAMQGFSSAYFCYQGLPGYYVKYEAHQCKLCGKTKIEKLQPEKP